MKSIFILWACLLILIACSDKDQDGEGDLAPARLGEPFNADLQASTSLVVSEAKLIGTKTLIGAAKNSDDVGLSMFEVDGLYELVKTHCGSCHAGQSKGPQFASAGVHLAYESIKPYLTHNPDDSLIVANIRAGHNGVAPRLAAAFADKIDQLAPNARP